MRASQRYYYRLMSNCMPGLVEPYKMAAKQQVLDGELALSSMLRVSKGLASQQGNLAYKLGFLTDQQGLCVISGELHGLLNVRCQRCMQTFNQIVGCTFAVSPVKDDMAAKDLPDEYEPVILVDGKVDLPELIEDELILAMPIVAMHAENDSACIQPQVETQQAQAELKNPFQVLQALKFNNKGKQK